MPTQGPNFGSSAADVGGGLRSWVGAANVYTSNDTWATSFSTGSNELTNYLEVTGFGFTIPSSTTIDGVEVVLEVSSTDGSPDSETISLINSGVIGNNLSGSEAWPSGADVNLTYGGATETWGATLNSTVINASTFGVRIRVLLAGSGAMARLDAVTIKVYYTVVAPQLDANSGSYVVTGTATSLTWNRKVNADVGVYALTGTSAGLTETRPIAIDPGSYALTGSTVDFETVRTLVAASGAYTLTGHPAFPVDAIMFGSGAYGVEMEVITQQSGAYRIANNIDGYNVYIGEDALPDLTTPTTFSLTLPASVAITPPGVGTKMLYVVVRKQDQYGLESQNQFIKAFKIDTAGELVRLPLSSPQGLQLSEMTGGYVWVLCAYPAINDEDDPPSHWKVWAGTTEPNTTLDAPVVSTSMTNMVLATQIGPFSPGTIHVKVAAYRNLDTALSAVLYDTIDVSETPDQPMAVRSGHQED